MAGSPRWIDYPKTEDGFHQVTRLQRATHFKVYVTTPALRSALFDPVALPAFAHQRLWAHTLDEMHWRGRAQSRVQRGLEK